MNRKKVKTQGVSVKMKKIKNLKKNAQNNIGTKFLF